MGRSRAWALREDKAKRKVGGTNWCGKVTFPACSNSEVNYDRAEKKKKG